MTTRRGEKIGWTGGWLGATLWLLILAIVWLVQGKTAGGIVGVSVYAVEVILIFGLAPWRHPRTPYWKLLLPLYLVLVAAIMLFVRVSGGMKAAGLSWWSFLWLGSMLIPLPTMGKRRWVDGEQL